MTTSTGMLLFSCYPANFIFIIKLTAASGKSPTQMRSTEWVYIVTLHIMYLCNCAIWSITMVLLLGSPSIAEIYQMLTSINQEKAGDAFFHGIK